MRTPQRPLQLLDPLLLLGIGPRGCASPPKRSLGSRFYFVLPTVIEIRSNLVLTAGLSHVPALQTFQHNLPFLFRGSLDSRLSRHSRLLAEAPSLTNFRVQFYWGALQFGPGTNHPYDICPTGTRFPYTYMDLNLEDGRQIHFRRISKGTGFADAVFRHENTSSEFYGAQIAWNGDGWTLDFRDGRRFLFPEAYQAKNYAQGAPTEMRNADGHPLQ